MSKRKIDRNHNEEPEIKSKYTIERFTAQGKYEDEITMLFDDGKQLYVSKHFLCHVSHIFYAMFDKNSEYVENKDGTIKMVDKCYDDILELLLHLDPNIQKEVDKTNVFEIVRLAEEYMIVGSIRKCRICLMTLINTYDQFRTNDYQPVSVDILLTASKYGYNDIQDRATEVISKWKKFWPGSYDRIPEGFKLKILEKRLNDNGDKLVPAGRGAR